MSTNRIICIGNRLVCEDTAGLAVYDRLQTRDLPDGVRVIEGGLAGLNLLPLLERGGRVVFVDAVSGFAEAGTIVVLDRDTLLRQTSAPVYGHSAGLPYLLAVLPHVCEGTLPEEITLVGLEGLCTSEVIDEAATLSIEIAIMGHRLLGMGRSNG